jgi:hypothetical protein
MIVDVAQRWRGGRATYKPAGIPIDTRAHEVAPILDDGTAKRFVLEHHYLGTYPAARARFGLWRGETLVGVAVYSVPTQPKCLDVIPGGREAAVELGRLVLLDEVAANGESWFVARTFELLRAAGFEGVLSHADPVPRVVDGLTLFPGHVGTIYQATNANYFGRSAPRTLRLLRSGQTLAPRALTKIRKRERGHAYAEAQLVAAGAEPLEKGECPYAWLERWLPRLTTPLRHTGQHRYAWALTKAGRRHLPEAQAYPKVLQRNV